MRSFIEASIVLALSVAVTVSIIAAIFPNHALGGDSAVVSSAIRAAVLVSETYETGCPFGAQLSDQEDGTRCPYLGSVAAQPTCPAMPERDARSSCPYLDHLHRELFGVGGPEGTPAGQHT